MAELNRRLTSMSSGQGSETLTTSSRAGVLRPWSWHCDDPTTAGTSPPTVLLFAPVPLATASVARSADQDPAAAAVAAARLGPDGSTPQQVQSLQSTSDVSRSASSTETAGDRRKAPPLLLADLEKELNKLHTRHPLHHVMSTPLLSTQDEATQSENGALAQWETVGPIDTTHTQPIQLVSFQTNSGASTPSSTPGTPVRRGRFAITVSRTSVPSPPPLLSPVSEPPDVEHSALFVELLGRQRQRMTELLRQQEEERERLRRELLDQLRRPPPDDG
ncbi:nascent polypeptide-associated complex subunit alpha, muscle-specific form-like isoform X2 [Pollicipes pollicipes]|uniref:nascent polypeptide-associated complex subunit alpha, muscle-specific form-like isoform X2 n=1 Tax=Pollicipes pollicipes TaxID=41117 RepID=UPI001884B7A8|nr:nascent polypeptide-associated complex subunit alpha, muscle-specific form-like isoform X2 [Pollicipes pollicipes]